MPPPAPSSKLFDTQATEYAKYRPTYPDELYDAIYAFADLPSYGVALDVATGSAQAALKLTDKFERVVAIDPNEKMLSMAQPHPNLELRFGSAENLDVPPESVDLITVAQALHWFDLRRFYSEAKRVLSPHGALAAWTYGLARFEDNPVASDIIHNFCWKDMGPYWAHNARDLTARTHTELPPLPEEFGVVETRMMEMRKAMPFLDFLRYLETWSSYNTFKKDHPDARDPLLDFREECMTALRLNDESEVVTVVFDLAVILAKQKCNDSDQV
ncbi:hypothetical protein BSKO_10096 [Bryopsis sp. KO-2023]|nr:hypothetical protein BSKO_10096 [Bryopsis sp. KO-2023]